MDLSYVTNDPLDGENFVVQRSQGWFSNDGWSEQYATLNYFGIVSIANPKTVEMLPDADRVNEVIVINCELPLYVTRLNAAEGGPATSDLVMYTGAVAPEGTYRVIQVHNYKRRGFFWALATRMAGA